MERFPLWRNIDIEILSALPNMESLSTLRNTKRLLVWPNIEGPPTLQNMDSFSTLANTRSLAVWTNVGLLALKIGILFQIF